MKKNLNLCNALFIAFFAVTVVVSSCMNNKKGNGSATDGSAKAMDTSGLVKIDTADFSMYIPKDWNHYVGTAMSTYKAYYIMAPKENNFTPNMNVLHQNIGNQSMDDYIKLNETQMKAMNINIEKTGDIQVGDMTGKYFMSTFNMQGRSIAIKSYFCIHNQTAYVITGTCQPAETDKFYPLFDRIVTTFRLK